MADVIIALVICVPFFLLGVAACWDKWQEYHSPLGAALRERQQKKERYMAELISYGWSKYDADTRAEVRLNVEAKATENVV